MNAPTPVAFVTTAGTPGTLPGLDGAQCLELRVSRIVYALADGCNLGQKPFDAARKASQHFNEYLVQRMLFNDTAEAGRAVEEAIVRLLAVRRKVVFPDSTCNAAVLRTQPIGGGQDGQGGVGYRNHISLW